MLTVLLFSVSMCALEVTIRSDRRFIAAMLRSTTCCPSSASNRAELACCEAWAALPAISWAAAPSSLMAAATLLVRLDCSSELVIDEFEALMTRRATSLTCSVAEDTSRIEL
ncbi:hypothetical protein D3C75_1103550 [compost metagenome]